MAKTQHDEIGQLERTLARVAVGPPGSAGVRDVTDGVRAIVAIACGIRRTADADGVHD
ncbi:hypothetical protein GGD61_005146 [Bradyrhizobium sp. SBR1B]|nr:hypothetical protein [Bradyrhizobium sp. SBR1B]